MINLVEIGKRIQTLREKSNLSQDMVADYLYIDKSIVEKIEMGEENITSYIIEKLSALFCCPVSYILLGESYGSKCDISLRYGYLTPNDLNALAKLNKIVLNQFELDKLVPEFMCFKD